MLTTVRAALAASMLFGFYLYALAIAGVLLWLTVMAASVAPGAVAAKLALVALAVPLGVLVATWRVANAPQPEPHGAGMPETLAPALWAEVRRVAEAVGTRAPDEIRLTAEVNAAVTEHTRWLGLIGGRRFLYLGMPLLQTMTVSQLRAVLAHEMGHYSRSHTRLGGLTYRGGDAMIETVRQVGPASVTGWLLRAYHRLYLLLSMAVKRRQEIEADRAMVRVAGRDAAAGALRELPVLGAAWSFYLDAYVGSGLDSGHAPTGVLAGFPVLLRARGEEMARLRESGPPEQTSTWDSHPPMAQRIALVEAEPDVAVPADDRPATELLSEPERHIERAERASFDFGDRERVPMERYSAVVAQHHLQREVDRVLRAVARAGGRPYGLAAVFDEVTAGRWPALVQHCYPDTGSEELPEVASATMEMLLNLAAVRSGAARWQHSWSGPVKLCRNDGEPLDLSELAALAAAPETLPEARSRLPELGIDADAVTVVEQRATLTGATVLAGLTNVAVDGTRSDLVILDVGLVVVPAAPWTKARKSPARLYELINSHPPEALARVTNGRFVPAEEILAVRARRIPRRYALHLHGGGRVNIRWRSGSEQVGKGWQALDNVLAAARRAAIPAQPAAGADESPPLKTTGG